MPLNPFDRPFTVSNLSPTAPCPSGIMIGKRERCNGVNPVFFLPAFVGSGCANLKRLAYEGFGRDRWQHAEEVVSALKVEPGSHVADLGSGSGYFTFRLADAVGRNVKSYA